jgi:ABC-2 type transport system ATP-binding protein
MEHCRSNRRQEIMGEIAVEAMELTKVFPGNVSAVAGLDMAIPMGGVYGLIGRNGAGKTTLIRLLLGLLHPTGGSSEILGKNFFSAPPEHRMRVAYVPQEQQIHAWMTLGELCLYFSHFYSTWDQAYAETLGGRFGLVMDRQIGLMSGGERRKAAILLALSTRAEALIMDEPAAGLDPIARRELIDALVETLSAGNGQMVLFSTHIISDLERIADHIGIMDRGKLVMSGRLDEIQMSIKRVQIIFDGDGIPDGFTLPGAVRFEAIGPVYTAIVRMADEAALNELASQHHARFQMFPLGLENIFIEIFGRDGRSEFINEECRR